MRRLSVHVNEWDNIPRRLPAGGSRVIPVNWYATIPRHTISVTADAHDMINLLVIPSGTAAVPAQAAMEAAMSSQGSPLTCSPERRRHRPEDPPSDGRASPAVLTRPSPRRGVPVCAAALWMSGICGRG